MNKRILIIGGVAGGASVAARARRLDAGAEIIMFERGPHVSFSNCSLPYYLSGVVGNSDALLMMSPEKFKKYLRQLVKNTRNIYKQDKIFVFAWNEWAEGGYLEPDEKFGYGYLEAIRDVLGES